MVDSVIGTEGVGFFELLFISGCRDHARVKQLRNLDGGDADAGTGSEHKNCLARANICATDEHVPRSQKHQRHTRSLIKI